ncbi:MAG: protein-methionine-sulfoxide reductase catalytic subunit MsrP [Chloroflexi bacterium]|nr:protein-methionine-sulfoxide reductase catalytic subunit MsrP [Chloroflexota bacterium]
MATPEGVYLRRREFMRATGGAALAALLAACGVREQGPGPAQEGEAPSASAQTDELGHPLTPYESVIGYTNYYEFTFSKSAASQLAAGLRLDPWSVQVDGLVEEPRTYTMQDLLALPHEERIYRMRCVEAWSMVIPWLGFPLSLLLEEVRPRPEARFVRFESLADPEQMPAVRAGDPQWPYVEGLRLDEAQHPLTIVATGLYGKPLTPQNGAPVRVVVPWKYGFKNAKAIVRISLVEDMPETYWVKGNPREYGFYANVNPEVPHPRWSQATEREIGRVGQRPTVAFNGYDVAALYAGQDLAVDF